MSELLRPTNRVLPRVGQATLGSLVTLLLTFVVCGAGILAYEVGIAPSTSFPQGLSVLGTIGIAAPVSWRFLSALQMREGNLDQVTDREPTLALSVLMSVFYSSAVVFGAIFASYTATHVSGPTVVFVAAAYPFVDVWLGNRFISPSLIVTGVTSMILYAGYYVLRSVLDLPRLVAKSSRLRDIPAWDGFQVLVKESPVDRISRLRRPR